MKKYLLSLALLTFLLPVASQAFSQSKTSPEVLAIRKEYQAAQSLIEGCEAGEEEPCGLYLNSLTVNPGKEPWAAVGIFTSKVDFWYERARTDEGDPFLLRKINIETQRSARTETEEMLFDASGKLRFYYFHLVGDGDEANAQEFRFYFKQEELIDYVEKVGAAELEFRYFSKEASLEVLANAKHYVDQFQLMMARY